MQITTRAHADAVVAAPEGRIDHAAAAEFERAIAPLLEPASGARKGLVLDFGHVTYISSVGLRVLMMAGKKLRTRNARIAVAGLQPIVAEIMAICRFAAVVEIFPTVDQALEAFAGERR